MRISRRGCALGVSLALVSLAAGCGGGGGSGSPASGPALTITGLGWLGENIDPSYWTTPPASGQTAFYDFWIHYAGDIAYADIQSARVYEPGGRYWVINRDARYFSSADRTIGGYGHWYGSTSPNLLPIGPMRAEVVLNNGQVASYTAAIPAPASATSGGYTSMHSEELLSPPSGSAPMIRRATAGAASTLTAATQTIRITFSVADPRVFSGYIWFFDAARTYLGGFFYMRDPWTGAIGPQLGGVLNTDGTANVLTLRAADLQLEPGATFAQIAQFQVGLTDGEQYAPQTTGRLRRDCRSIGAMTSLVLQ